jgi:hypothetical protein
MKTKLLLLSFFAGALVVTIVVRGITVRAQQSPHMVSDAQIAARIVDIKPFTITSKSAVSFPDGHTESGDSQTWTSDKDRQAHRTTFYNGKTGVVDIDEIEIRAGVTRTVINTVTKSKTTTRYGPGYMTRVWAGSIDPGSNCLNLYRGTAASTYSMEVDGFEEDNGVRLIRMKQYSNPSAATLTWRAPDYGCAPVKMIYNWKGEGGKTTMDIVSASLGHVDETLFNIPQDYKEVMPSEYYVRQANATSSGKFARANDPDRFAKEMQNLKAQFKAGDDYWLAHRVVQ